VIQLSLKIFDFPHLLLHKAYGTRGAAPPSFGGTALSAWHYRRCRHHFGT